MKRPTPERLWAILRREALVQGEMPPRPSASGWYVRILLGVAGWLGALLVLGFLGTLLHSLLRHGSARTSLGVLACGLAVGLFHAGTGSKKAMADQFALALSLAGQVLFLSGVFDPFHGGWQWLVGALFYGVLLALVPDFLHRLWCALILLAILTLWLGNLRMLSLLGGLGTLASLPLWFYSERSPVLDPFLRPLAYGLILGVLGFQGLDFFLLSLGDPGFWTRSLGFSGPSPWASWVPWLSHGLFSLSLWLVVGQVLQREGIPLLAPPGLPWLAVSVLIALLTFPAPGLTLALTLMLLGFAQGNRVLLALGLAAAVASLSHFYYQLHLNLAVKAAILAGTGLILLALRQWLATWLPMGKVREGMDHG